MFRHLGSKSFRETGGPCVQPAGSTSLARLAELGVIQRVARNEGHAGSR